MKIIDYNNILDKIVSSLSEANTTTAVDYLSDGLSRKIKTIERSDLEIESRMQGEYPIISVDYVSSQSGEAITMNSNNTDDSVLINFKLDLVYDGTEAEDNLWTMASNVDNCIRVNSMFDKYIENGLSSTYMISNIGMPIIIGNDSSFNKAARINLSFVGTLSDI